MERSSTDFFRFLSASPTVWHAAHEVASRFKEAGFSRLDEGSAWKLHPGGSYYFTRGGSMVIAFRLPKKGAKRMVAAACHLDSPALKVKPKSPASKHEISLLATELYGAPLLHTWLDRELVLAGRIAVKNSKGHVEHRLVSFPERPLLIPNVAIHLNREVNEKGAVIHKQDHLKAVWSVRSSPPLEKWLSGGGGEELLSYELLLVPAEKGGQAGFERELMAAYRLDNLTSAYAMLEGLVGAQGAADDIQLAIFWDHEEIGSQTATGAYSSAVQDALERICLHSGLDRESFFALKSRSMCLSLDVCHGFHPNFADKYDPDNSPFLGKGVALKHNANQKYATSSITGAWVEALARSEQIPLQLGANRSDLPSGSTVGSIMAASIGAPVADIGIPLWAMHSAREVGAWADLLHLSRLTKAAFERSPEVER